VLDGRLFDRDYLDTHGRLFIAFILGAGGRNQEKADDGSRHQQPGRRAERFPQMMMRMLSESVVDHSG
jgi:hypothetical protein